ncbi:MAG: hypothetical protein O4859_18450 [Trichodesmium sp. St18_bin1]|nr:hypothetical protein [Trichodesmium sp. St18_bin1]MDE5122067.1 hypothetical protein [Trichodesmium sp. St19_bin1]
MTKKHYYGGQVKGISPEARKVRGEFKKRGASNTGFVIIRKQIDLF